MGSLNWAWVPPGGVFMDSKGSSLVQLVRKRSKRSTGMAAACVGTNGTATYGSVGEEVVIVEAKRHGSSL
jgi:hypothetical protein